MTDLFTNKERAEQGRITRDIEKKLGGKAQGAEPVARMLVKSNIGFIEWQNPIGLPDGLHNLYIRPSSKVELDPYDEVQIAYGLPKEEQGFVAVVNSKFESQVVWHVDHLPKDGTKLYTKPQPWSKRAELSHMEYYEIGRKHWLTSNKVEEIYREVEAKLKEKNA